MAEDKTKIYGGINLESGSAGDKQGDLRVDSGDGKLKYHDGSSEETIADTSDITDHASVSSGVHGVTGSVVGTTDTQTLTNKSIDADANTITNIEDADIKTGAAIDAAKIHDGSVSNTEYGYLNGVTSAIQTQIDSKASSTDLTTHTGASSGVHGVTGSVVGTTDTQTLTNKSIDADLNTITNLAHGSEVDNPSSGVHGVTGSVVGTTDTQALSNKDVDGGTASNTNRITIPKNTKTNLDGLTRKEATIVYATDEAKAYIDNGTDLVAVGSGSGSGSKNYISQANSLMEESSNDWTAYNDGTDYLDGTGGTSSLTVTTTTTASEILEGDKSLEIQKPASDVQYEGVSVLSEAIDRADQGKVLFANMSVDFSAATGEHWEVRAYDVTNSSVLYTGPSEARAIPAKKGLVSVPVYTNSDTASIRLSIHCTSNNTDAYDVFVDEVKLGPSGVSLHDPSSEWQQYTPTTQGFGTISSVNVWYKRNKDSIDIRGTFVSGTSTAVEAQIGLPNGLTIDSTKVSNLMMIGDITKGGASTTNQWVAIGTGGDTFINVAEENTGTGVDAAVNGNSLVSSGNTLLIDVEGLAIAEWANSSNILNENQLALQTINVSGAGNAGTVLTANTTDIDWTQTEDSHSLWNGTTFGPAPRPMKVKLDGAVNLTGSVQQALRIYRDTVADKYIYNATAADTLHTFSGSVILDTGESFTIRPTQAATLSNSTDNHHISITSVEDFTLYGAVQESRDTRTVYLASDVTTNTTIHTFNNLEVGRWYEVDFNAVYQSNVTDSWGILIQNGGAHVVNTGFGMQGTASQFPWGFVSKKFQATATTLTFTITGMAAGTQVNGNGTDETSFTLTEIAPLRTTTKWD